MKNPAFLVGEYVERLVDGTVGIVKRIDKVGDDEWAYAVHPHEWLVSGDLVWTGTERAWRRHHRIHAHVATASRDCDGDYRRGHTDVLSALERCAATGDLRFKRRVVTGIVSLHGHGTLTVTPDGCTWYEQTDEGYVETEVTWCEEEDCAEGVSFQRDLRAERMGY